MTDATRQALAYERTIDTAKACGAKVTQHEIGFTHAEFERFLAALSCPEPEGAEAVAWAAFAENGNVRLWSRDSKQVREFCESAGLELTPLFAHPPRESGEDAQRWMPIETAPDAEQRDMFVVRAFNVRNGFTGGHTYTSDAYCVWRDIHGGFARWPHNFAPTHWMPLPSAPDAARRADGGNHHE